MFGVCRLKGGECSIAGMCVGAFHLGYCINVYLGEFLDAICVVLRRDVSVVKARVSPDEFFGTGFCFGHVAADWLGTDEDVWGALVVFMEELELYVFSVNGFFYGDFVAELVKVAVYELGWGSFWRLDYIVVLVGVLADLLGLTERTISTVAGGFGFHTRDDGVRQ